MNHLEKKSRGDLKDSSRIVIKLGTLVVTDEHGRPSRSQLQPIVQQVAQLTEQGKKIVLVSSGAIGAGMEVLGLEKRPEALPELQMCASVGQARLMSVYDDLFSTSKLNVGQVLLTRDGLVDSVRSKNVKNTLTSLFRQKIIPVVNENDVVAVEELCFGDNDMLAVMVAKLIEAELVLLLSSLPGLMTEVDDSSSLVPFVAKIDANVLSMVKEHACQLSTGGMKSKLEAANLATSSGIATIMARGVTEDIVNKCLAGENEGTLFAPQKGS